MSWDAAALIEPAANAVHAWRLAGGAGMRVAVLGCGAIGLFCLLVALADGAASVDVTDLADAGGTGARLGAAAARADPAGEYDVIVDAVGSAVTRAQSVAPAPGWRRGLAGTAGQTPGSTPAPGPRAEAVLGSFAYTTRTLGGPRSCRSAGT